MKLLRNTYFSRLISYENEAYNLPLDVIYYVESVWNYKLNDYVYSHKKEIEQLFSSNIGGFFPYRLEIISYEQFLNPAIQAQLQHIHPESPNIDFTHLNIPQLRQKELEYELAVAERLATADRSFENSFICRIAPRGDESAYGFYAIDVSLSLESLVLVILREYVQGLTAYNIQAVNKGIDYTLPIEEHIVLSQDHSPIPTPKPSKGFDWRGVVTKIIAASVGPFLGTGAFSSRFPIFPATTIRPSKGKSRTADVDPQTAQRIQEMRKILDSHQKQFGFNILLDELGTEIIEELRNSGNKPLSSLVIDAKKRYNPILPEYKKEIDLNPVEKTIYIFFLQHLEGIRLKEISAYKHEIKHIYSHVTTRDDLEKMNNTVNDIVDPSKNRLNEAMSKLNSKICKELAPVLADKYRIKGSRGGVYRIHLNESKIKLPDILKAK